MTKFLDWKNDPNLSAMVAMDDPQNAQFWEGVDQFAGKVPVRVPTVGGPGVSAPSAGAGATAGLRGQVTPVTLPEAAMSALKKAGGRPVTFKNGKTFVLRGDQVEEVK
jgi:hypothetical protein